MNTPLRFRWAATLVLCCIIAAGCATPTKKKEHKTTIDQKGVQVLAILAQLLFPPNWDEPVQVSIARRMLPLEYHGDTIKGKTLVQSKVTFDAAALQKLLVDTKRTTPSFKVIANYDEAFGKDANTTSEGTGVGRQLSWWEPAKNKNATYYFWERVSANRPASRVWLQVSDDKKNTKLVYIRIESE